MSKTNHPDIIHKPDMDLRLKKYRDFLIEFNKTTNIASKKIDIKNLDILISESMLLERYSNLRTVIDAGSGNGLLGIPLALSDDERKVYLVETRKKKTDFLEKAVNHLCLENTSVQGTSIKEFFNKRSFSDGVLVARGFPDNLKLMDFLKTGKIKEILLITSLNKIKKIRSTMEMFEQSIYNIPFRDQIKILKMENVSRETK